MDWMRGLHLAMYFFVGGHLLVYLWLFWLWRTGRMDEGGEDSSEEELEDEPMSYDEIVAELSRRLLNDLLAEGRSYTAVEFYQRLGGGEEIVIFFELTERERLQLSRQLMAVYVPDDEEGDDVEITWFPYNKTT